MSFHRDILTTPGKLEAALADVDGSDLRKEERAQLEAAVAAVPALAETVSKREALQITLTGHSDPDAEGFDPRNLTITLSRLDPVAAEQLRTTAEDAERELAAAQAAVDAARERAEAAQTAADAAGA
jgi:hypothetical protein